MTYMYTSAFSVLSVVVRYIHVQAHESCGKLDFTRTLPGVSQFSHEQLSVGSRSVARLSCAH